MKRIRANWRAVATVVLEAGAVALLGRGAYLLAPWLCFTVLGVACLAAAYLLDNDDADEAHPAEEVSR